MLSLDGAVLFCVDVNGKGLPMVSRYFQTVLLVEDEETDIINFMRSSKKVDLKIPVEVKKNGDAALEYLRGKGNANGVVPFVIITDINMPGINGHELIEELRKDPKICNSPVFILSTSMLPADIERAYSNHVAGYIYKEESFDSTVRLIKEYCDNVMI